MRQNCLFTAFALMAFLLGGAQSEPLTPQPIFESAMTAPNRAGAAQPFTIKVQSWELASQEGRPQELPLRGFYIAHLLSGDISTTIDGQTTKQPPGAYWAVKSGATMQVKVNGQVAVVETLAIAKQ